jgi:DNA end-binding protein Ku
MAEKLVDGMVSDWDPEKYRDSYESDLMALIEKRVKSGDTAAVETPVPQKPMGKVVDLMALLKRSVEDSGKPKPATRSTAKPSAKPKAKPKAAAKRTKKKAAPAPKASRKTAARKSA